MKLNILADAASTRKDLYAVRVWDTVNHVGCAYVNIKNTANAVFDVVRRAHANEADRKHLVVSVYRGTRAHGKQVARYVGGKSDRLDKPTPLQKPTLAERQARQARLED